MGIIDYSKEPVSDIAFIDMKSFYASVECVERGLHPLKTSLCVMSRADNSLAYVWDSKKLSDTEARRKANLELLII